MAICLNRTHNYRRHREKELNRHHLLDSAGLIFDIGKTHSTLQDNCIYLQLLLYIT